MKKFRKYIISILLTIIIFSIALYLNKIYPFGKYDFTKLDGYYQYKPFLFHFINSIKNGNLTNYSFLSALGNPTIFLFIYYLASPLNLIALLFENPNSMFFSVILLKIILSNLTANYYFSKKTNNEIISIILSLCYSLSAWIISYYFSNMWLDAFLMFPLFQLGLEELINNNKYLLYILSLSYIMYTNFYLAFTICLYTLIYYIANKIIKKEKYLHKIQNFDLIFISTIVTCLISSFIIYATYTSFLKMGISINNINNQDTLVSIPDFFKSLLAGVTNINVTKDSYAMPNISSSILITISTFYFFINSNIPLKERIRNFIYLILIIILLKSNYLNYLANCFHTPVGFSYRYSFIIIFYFLKLFIRNYQTFENKIDKKIFFIIALLLIITFLEYRFNNLSFELLIFNICLLISYTIYLLSYSNNNLSKILLISIVFFELTVSATINLHTTKELETFDIQKYNESKERLDYRKTNITESVNLNYYNNESTITYFSSMQYGSSVKILSELGCPSDYKATIFTCNNTDVFNMLFNVKNDRYYLEKIYATKNKQEIQSELVSDDIHELQNAILYLLTDIDDVLVKENLTKKKNNNVYEYTIKEAKKYYIQKNFNIKRIEVKDHIYENPKYFDNQVKDRNIKEYLQITADLEKDDIIKIEYIDDQTEEEIIYSLDEEKLKKAYDYLKDNQIEYTNYSYNKIEGTITTEENEIIFTTIPYDENWLIKIDNQEVKPIKAINSFLAIKTNKGTHKITLEYKNHYTIPIIISISSFILTLLFYFKQKKKNH